MNRQAALKDLTRIPGIGPRMADDLLRLGYSRVEQLCDQDAEEMYERLMLLEGRHVDRCVLYVFRCAVHFAETPEPDPDSLKWWNWKDR
ncbi:MAG: helix-hairpin-helix domain-containing protein [Desulfovibrionaceae bacterium]